MMENYTDLVKGMDSDRKVAEHFVLNYEAELKDYEARKKEYLEGQRIDSDKVGGKSNLPGRPVEAKAIKSADYDLQHHEYLWLKAVEIALRTFGERKRIFINVRKEAAAHGNYNEGHPGRRAWVVYTQRRYAEEIQKRFINAHGWVSEKTIRLWWEKVVDCIVEIHLRLKINF